MRRLLLIIAISVITASCAAERSTAEYAAEAGELAGAGERVKAIEVLHSGLYSHPDDYGLNMLMARMILKTYTDLTPHARSRYLARYYLKKAASVAPDRRRAEVAMNEYERVRRMQRGKSP